MSDHGCCHSKVDEKQQITQLVQVSATLCDNILIPVNQADYWLVPISSWYIRASKIRTKNGEI